jgi:hypothetical protein
MRVDEHFAKTVADRANELVDALNAMTGLLLEYYERASKTPLEELRGELEQDVDRHVRAIIDCSTMLVNEIGSWLIKRR